MDYLCYLCLVSRVCSLLSCGHLLGKGWPLGYCLWCLIVLLSLSHMVSLVRFGTWLYQFLIFAPFLLLRCPIQNCILTELNANDVKIISVERQKLDLSKDAYLWYRKFLNCGDTAWFYEHKNAPYINRGSYVSAHILLNLLIKLRKSDKMRSLLSILSLFCNDLYKFNSTDVRMLNSIYHIWH